jgi:hypothetical protein
MLFKLSHDLIIELLTVWFDAMTLSVLDSSVCNRESRSLLLNTFSSSLFVHSGFNWKLERFPKRLRLNYAYNGWVVLRKIRIIELLLETPEICTEEFQSLLTNKLQSLIVDVCTTQKGFGYKTNNYFKIRSDCLKLISSKCSELRNLEIIFSNADNEIEVIEFLKSNTHLQRLQLSNDGSLGDKCLKQITLSCVNIKKVNISHMEDNFSWKQIMNILVTCKSITSIRLSNYYNTRDFRMRIITEQNVKKRSVRVTGFEETSELDKQTLIQSLESTCVLWFTNFTITNAFIMRSLQTLNELTILTLSGCGCSYSSVGLISLVSHCKKLRKIHLTSCCHLSNSDLENILTVEGNVLEVIGIAWHQYLDLSTLCAIVFANKNKLSQVYVADCAHLRNEGRLFYRATDYTFWLESNLKLHNSNIVVAHEPHDLIGFHEF